MKKISFYCLLFIWSSSLYAQSPVGSSTSERANEVATNTQKSALTYANANKPGPTLVIALGEIKSNNATFTQKVTANNIADYAELELSRANFKITKNQANAKYIAKFDVLKAESVAKAKSGFSGGAIGGLLGGIGGAVLGTVKTEDGSEVWVIGMRYQLVDPKSGDVVGMGYSEERMELGEKGTSVMGISDGASGGATLDTLVQYLVQKNIVEMDSKHKAE